MPGEEAPVAGVAPPPKGGIRLPPNGGGPSPRRMPLGVGHGKAARSDSRRVLEPDAEQPDRRVGRTIGRDGGVGGVDHVRRVSLPVYADAVVPLAVGGEVARRERREQPLAQTGVIELDEREPGEAERNRPATSWSPAPELRGRRDDRRQVGVDPVEEGTATAGRRGRRARSGGTARRAKTLPHGPQPGRPFGRDERPCPLFEPAQPVAVDDVHRSHDPGLGGQTRPAREALRVGRGVPTSNRRRVGLEPEEGQRDLAVELPAELGRAGACPGSQPRRVGLSDLPEPPVLQRREDREEHRQRDRPQQEGPMGPPGG